MDTTDPPSLNTAAFPITRQHADYMFTRSQQQRWLPSVTVKADTGCSLHSRHRVHQCTNSNSVPHHCEFPGGQDTPRPHSKRDCPAVHLPQWRMWPGESPGSSTSLLSKLGRHETIANTTHLLLFPGVALDKDTGTANTGGNPGSLC